MNIILKNVDFRQEVLLHAHRVHEYLIRKICSSGNLYLVKCLFKNTNIVIDLDKALYYAVYSGHLNVAKFFVSKNANVRTYIELIFYHIADKQFLDIIRYLVEVHNINPSTYNDILLNVSSKMGYLLIVQYLVETYYKKYESQWGDWALRNCIYYGHYDIAKYLLENGVDKRNAIIEIQRYKKIITITKIVPKVECDDRNKYDGDNFYITSAIDGNMNALKIHDLTRKDMITQDIRDSAFYYHCLYGRIDIHTVKYLHRNGSNIHQEEALIRCACNGYVDIVQYLIENGVHVDILHDYCGDDNVLWMLLHYDIEYYGKVKLVIRLIEQFGKNRLRIYIDNIYNAIFG